jgi:hypothetical protein
MMPKSRLSAVQNVVWKCVLNVRRFDPMRTMIALVAVAALAGLGACSNHKAADSKGSPAAASANAGMLANSKCPIVPDHPIDPAVTVMFKSSKVGFCCAGCIDEWDKVSESKKTELLAKAK